MASETDEYLCSICDEQYEHYADLIQHQLDEHGQQPHPFDEGMVVRSLGPE
jgi:hypothetical protein